MAQYRWDALEHPPAGTPTVLRPCAQRTLVYRDFRRRKSTLANENDLGFSDKDRKENIRRVGEVAKLFYEHGNIVLCAFVSPFKADRDVVRRLFPDGDFFEIQVSCEKETAIKRDPKGLYAKALKGEIVGLTEFDGIYEENPDAELRIQTDDRSIEDCVKEVMALLSVG